MEILFTKTSKGYPVISCRRKDGSVTWKLVSSFFILHDLCHFAVETTIPLKNAFYGMVAGGIDINDFDLPKEQRKFQLAEEAIFAERLVNLLTIEYTQGRMENFMEMFTGIYEDHNGSDTGVLIKEDQLEKIRKNYKELMKRWDSLPGTETMTLLFEE
jgi:hypothetical protein